MPAGRVSSTRGVHPAPGQSQGCVPVQGGGKVTWCSPTQSPHPGVITSGLGRNMCPRCLLDHRREMVRRCNVTFWLQRLSPWVPGTPALRLGSRDGWDGMDACFIWAGGPRLLGSCWPAVGFADGNSLGGFSWHCPPAPSAHSLPACSWLSAWSWAPQCSMAHGMTPSSSTWCRRWMRSQLRTYESRLKGQQGWVTL